MMDSWELFKVVIGEAGFLTYTRNAEERIEFLELEEFSLNIKPNPLDHEQEKLTKFLGFLAILE